MIGTFFGARLQRWAEIAGRCDPDPSGWKDSSGAPGDPVSAYKKQRSGKRPGPFWPGRWLSYEISAAGIGIAAAVVVAAAAAAVAAPAAVAAAAPK